MPRNVRIATISMGGIGGPTPADNRRRMAGLVEQALAEKPDLVTIPESFTLVGLAQPRLEDMAEELDGPTLTMVAAQARRAGAYILCPILSRRANDLHIEAFLIDRQGRIAGSYQKHHPVVEGWDYRKVEFGSIPGRDCPVFNTDFGRIGVQICFDIEYRDGWDVIDRMGAELLVWLSAYDGGRDLVAKAWQYHRPLVSAVQSTYARILNLMGEVQAITGEHDRIAAATIDLETGLFHTDFNKSQIPALRAKYGPEVTLRIYHEEGCFTLQSNRADLTLSALIAEFQLDPLKDYLERNRRLQDALRMGEHLPALHPPHGERDQWV
jgi:predicted amidohydrolase